ncbi:DUF803-domain-containing protein [Periconia macrospinosa]|uniref:DUF803-domain-containing protein n=1 Tax=Periconia macrospinosa TaxID=97972 RepID=A0A2V1EEH3_9PLEO|nr:DUF803-domain-containing protein [Periconia macrospinosa]
MILPSNAANRAVVFATNIAILRDESVPSSSPSATPPGSGIGYPENWNSIIGVVTAIVGNVLISFALNMQRYAHIRLEREWQEKERRRKHTMRSRSYMRESETAASGNRKGRSGQGRHNLGDDPGTEQDHVVTEEDPLLPSTPSLNLIGEEEGNLEEPAYKQKSYLKSPYWWTGIILMTTGEAGNFLAYGFAPASIVSPLGVVALISNCIIAPLMLKEPYRKRDGLGVLIAVAGAVTVVLSANDNNPKLGPDEIWDLISTWEFETYLGITTAVIIALMVASNRFGEKNILIDLGLVGLFGGYTALSTKGVASMLSYTLWRAITFPVTYLLVAILVGTAVMQIKYVNRALQRFDATQVIPVQFVMFTLSVILGSAILYRDFERTSGEDAGKFVGGCAMTFLGVWLITSGRASREDDDELRDPEPEDAINLIADRYHDDVDDTAEEVAQSSRSSTIRVKSPPMNISRKISNGKVSQQHTPDISFTPQDQRPRTPPESHASDAPSTLNTNPWDGANSDSPYTRPLLDNSGRNTSSPILPSQSAEPNRPSTSSPDLSTPHYSNPPRPATPTRNASDTAAVTPTAPSTSRNRLRRMGTNERGAGRNSIPGHLLASPLSTSLSAMVADLKRGGSLKDRPGHREGSTADDGRRRQSILGLADGETHGEDMFGEPLHRQRTDTSTEGEGSISQNSAGNRSRSVSVTLQDMWRGLRGGHQDLQPDDEGETGNTDSQTQDER